jgi:transposase
VHAHNDHTLAKTIQIALSPLVVQIGELTDEVSRLRQRIVRPDLEKYSVEEAAGRIKRSRSSVYELMKAGELVPVREAGRTYLTEEEIQRWERTQRSR